MAPRVGRDDLLAVLRLLSRWFSWLGLRRPGRTAAQSGSGDQKCQHEGAKAPAAPCPGLFEVQIHGSDRTAPVNQITNLERRLLQPECSDFVVSGTSLDSAIYE
jgi:hypothetical protein